MPVPIQITKANGQLETFSQTKVRQSLKRAGAKQATINKILAQLIGQLYQGISTKEIYQKVFKLFDRYQSDTSYRYSLKEGLMDLGPSGYPFEKFVARLLTHLGYTVKTQVVIQGRCISHEIDVDAQKDNQRFMIECKYHNSQGIKSRCKDVLYTQARFEDVSETFDQPWLVTNTKLTTNAIKYGVCKNMKLLAWRYPQDKGLERLIEDNHLHPLTCFSFLNSKDRQVLLQNDYLFCQDLKAVKPSKFNDLGLSSATQKQLYQLINQSQSS